MRATSVRSDPPGLDELPPGATVGSYVVRELLARGGHGCVYRAEHSVLKRAVAIKILNADCSRSEEMIQRFVREAQAVNVIRHPNIVDIHDIGVMPNGMPFMVMELLSGSDLDTIVEHQGALPLDIVLDLVQPICAALHSVHCAGMVHRDLKASNVFLADGGPDGRPPQVKLLDFGIAKLTERATALEDGDALVTAAGSLMGTPSSMAPEQICGEPVDARTDVYALGVLVYQLLTGRLPFWHDDPLDLQQMQLHAAPPPMAGVAPELEAVVRRCLEKRRDRRYDGIPAFLAEFDAAAQDVLDRS